MGLDISTPTTFWKDKAIVEVNHAVLHSFQKSGITMVDHHSAAESFMKFMMDEQRTRGGCPADWVWIVPPISGSATPVFHQEMLMYKVKPYLDYQVLSMDQYSLQDLYKEECLLIVASTFGNGDPPDSGLEFSQQIKEGTTNGHGKLRKTNYAVFGLGSRAYAKFCRFAHYIDESLSAMGATRMINTGEGDELSGQEASFAAWARIAFQDSLKLFKITGKGIIEQAMEVLELSDLHWEPGKFRLASVNEKPVSVFEALSVLHHKAVIVCKPFERKDLQAKGSSISFMNLADLENRNRTTLISEGEWCETIAGVGDFELLEMVDKKILIDTGNFFKPGVSQ